MSGQALARVGAAVTVVSVLAAFAATPLLLFALVGVVAWATGIHRRETEWDTAADRLLASLPPAQPARHGGGDASEQLLRLARDAGVVPRDRQGD